MTSAAPTKWPAPESLTDEHFEVMEACIEGCDFLLPKDARLIREVEAFDPELITVTGPQPNYYEVWEKLPYLGAILTGKGQQLLREYQQKKGEVL